MKQIIIFAAGLCLCSSLSMAQSVILNSGHLDALDTDDDGAVSKDEFFQFATFAFNEMDRDNSATLSADEVDDHLAAERFQELDTNGDGSVSTDEFAQQMDADFREADKDGDGLLN